MPEYFINENKYVVNRSFETNTDKTFIEVVFECFGLINEENEVKNDDESYESTK